MNWECVCKDMGVELGGGMAEFEQNYCRKFSSN